MGGDDCRGTPRGRRPARLQPHRPDRRARHHLPQPAPHRHQPTHLPAAHQPQRNPGQGARAPPRQARHVAKAKPAQTRPRPANTGNSPTRGQKLPVSCSFDSEGVYPGRLPRTGYPLRSPGFFSPHLRAAGGKERTGRGPRASSLGTDRAAPAGVRASSSASPRSSAPPRGAKWIPNCLGSEEPPRLSPESSWRRSALAPRVQALPDGGSP
jgi:hypothetical protein